MKLLHGTFSMVKTSEIFNFNVFACAGEDQITHDFTQLMLFNPKQSKIPIHWRIKSRLMKT